MYAKKLKSDCVIELIQNKRFSSVYASIIKYFITNNKSHDIIRCTYGTRYTHIIIEEMVINTLEQ